MKILTIIALTLIIGNIITKETTNANLKKNEIKTDKSSKKQIIDRFPDAPVMASVSNDPFILQHQAGFRTPAIIALIPKAINNDLNQGIIEEASTFTSDKTYYDGSNNLNAIHVNCNLYTINPPSCVKQAGCGWCGEKNSCVSGSTSGPLAPCLRNTFLYSMPSPEWNPLKAGTINILSLNSKGQPQNTLTPSSDLSKLDVFNPYK